MVRKEKVDVEALKKRLELQRVQEVHSGLQRPSHILKGLYDLYRKITGKPYHPPETAPEIYGD